MPQAQLIALPGGPPVEDTIAFHCHVLRALNQGGVRFLVGGAYAFAAHTGIERPTKDLDLFVARRDVEAACAVLEAEGFETDLTYPHWLAKVHNGSTFIDLIFNSGNGVAIVDDEWFEHAAHGKVHGIDVLLSPVEEMLWSKAFIMERERYDGADVAHLVDACAHEIDWTRLMRRFEPHWRVLLSHLVLFGFVYPARRTLVPAWVMDALMEKLRAEAHAPAPQIAVCSGTLLSREQYLDDVAQRGYQDGRVAPFGNMSDAEVEHWTRSIPARMGDGG